MYKNHVNAQCTSVHPSGTNFVPGAYLEEATASGLLPCSSSSSLQNPRDSKRSQESKRHMWKKGHQNTIYNFQYIILIYINLYYIYVFLQYTYFIIFRDHAKAMQGRRATKTSLARPSSQGTCRWLQLHAWWASPGNSPAHLHWSVTISSSFCAKDGNLPAVTPKASFVLESFVTFWLWCFLGPWQQTKSCSCWRKHSILMLLYQEGCQYKYQQQLFSFKGTGIANSAPLLTPLCKKSRTCCDSSHTVILETC